MSSKAHTPNALKPAFFWVDVNALIDDIGTQCMHISFLCTFTFIYHRPISKWFFSIVFNQGMSWGCSTFDMWDNDKRSNPISCDCFTCIVTGKLCPTNRGSDGYSTTYFPLYLHACNKCQSEQKNNHQCIGLYCHASILLKLMNVVASQMLALKYFKIWQTFICDVDAT